MANDADYKRAANAVNSGTANKQQIELNDKMAKNAGNGGLVGDAKAAKEGKLDRK